jgi:transposase InsO family protein
MANAEHSATITRRLQLRAVGILSIMVRCPYRILHLARRCGAKGRIVSSFRPMLETIKLLWHWLVSLTRLRRRLEAEILLPRHQLNILRRNSPRRMALTNADRLLFVWFYRLCPAAISAVTIIRPQTLIRWHRRGFRAFWRWKSRPRGGRPEIPTEIRDLIREMSQASGLWGTPRIHGELLKLGIQIAESTVAKYMIKRPRRPGQSWRTFLRNHAEGIAAVNFFIVPTVGFKLLYCLVLLAHGRRQLMHYAVTAHPTAEWVAQQMVEAFPWGESPRYLMRDRDAVYGEVVKRRLRGLGIRDQPVAPRSPWQNAYVERLIGSARRECIDHVIVLGESHLRRIMSTYAEYYNDTRTHLALGKDPPIGRAIERFGRIVARPMVGGLHHRYTRI